MKLRHASAAATAFAIVATIAIVASGCNQPRRRNDWRSPNNTDPSRRPAPPASCTTDADCAAAHGACAIELGAAEGSCTTPPGLAPVPRGDGGPAQAPAQPGVPNVQPSPSDIHL